jgi:large subunit ribosomal protein L15
MKLGNLKGVKGSNKNRKRIGRGQGSGQGVTAGRGDKGQHARSGSKRRAWFEGGQMPLQRRLPKYGFVNPDKIEFQVVNLKDLVKVEKTEEITPEVLKQAGLIKSSKRPVKLLGDGEFDKKVNVKVHAISKTAKEKVEKRGGIVTLL